MITVQLLVQNNQATVRQALESVLSLKPEIVVGDLGCTDGTLEICRDLGAKIYHLRDHDRHMARNHLLDKSNCDTSLILEPWEAVVKGHRNLLEACSPAYVTILHGKSLSKQLRIGNRGNRFVDPVYERFDLNTEAEADVMLYSLGAADADDVMARIERWKRTSPLAAEPYYYQACLLLAERKYEEFFNAVEHYLFMDRSASISATMARYYYAMGLLVHRKLVKPTLQNLNLCLCERPLMAEFWCLTGDVYYHLLNRFDQAKEFYENALILGSRRLKTDKWPMDLPKYGEYPKKMIKSCEQILDGAQLYFSRTPALAHFEQSG